MRGRSGQLQPVSQLNELKQLFDLGGWLLFTRADVSELCRNEEWNSEGVGERPEQASDGPH